SIPRMGGAETERLASIGGTPPEPGRRPPGCPFAPRCALAEDICRQVVPQLAPLRDGPAAHRVACHVTNRALEAA
ncbi:MAG: oligopeptide/dipeptide ABC transporter ATP-binding protein, partial [Devosia sp.]